MSSAWFTEFSRRMDEVGRKENNEITTGRIYSEPTTADVVAMNYRERIGFLAGLARAYQIAEDVEHGKEL